MKVWLVGRSAVAANFKPDGHEVWGRNGVRPAFVRQWDRMFNLHRYAHLERDWADGLAAEKEWAAANPGVPFYTIDPWPAGALPKWRQFPGEAVGMRGMPRGSYHANSLDWLVAYAIYSNAEEIVLHGIRLAFEWGDPISSRPCLEYWCGYAEGRGIKVTATPESDLFAQYHIVKSNSVYGYDDVKLIEDKT